MPIPRSLLYCISRFLIVTLGLSSVPACATTVVALIDKRHHRVVLGVDGIVGRYYAGTTDPGCKLIVKPGCAFAMAGFLEKQQPVFRLQDLGEQACALPGTLKDKADGFFTVANDPVNSIAQYLRENEPKFYADTFSRNGGEFVYLVFAGTENGAAVAYARGYKIAPDGTVKQVSSDITGNGASGVFAGFTEHIAAYLKAHPKWAHADTATTVRKLLQMEATAHPEAVGQPFSILTVDHKGRQKWIDPGACPAIGAIAPAATP